MKINRKAIQLGLISIGLFLILATYFFYPKIYKDKFIEKEGGIRNEMLATEDDNSNTFVNIEYNGVYNINNPFTVSSEKAYILKEEPNIVYMTTMKVIMHMKDGRIIVITSDKGRYNKETYDTFFEDNVKATDGKTTILAENLDLLATEDFVTVQNNVVLTNDSGSLLADKIDYDFETKYYKISMFNDEKVKIKLIQ